MSHRQELEGNIRGLSGRLLRPTRVLKVETFDSSRVSAGVGGGGGGLILCIAGSRNQTWHIDMKLRRTCNGEPSPCKPERIYFFFLFDLNSHAG